MRTFQEWYKSINSCEHSLDYQLGVERGYSAGMEEAKPKWIDVNERLPDKDGLYATKIAYDINEFYFYIFQNYRDGFFYLANTKFWMDIPK